MDSFARQALWTETHCPKAFEDFVGNSAAVKEVRVWAENWKLGKKGKPLLFHGHTGSGKTLLAEITARENAWELFELNASDFRTKDIIERIAGAAALNSSFSGKLRLVLLDEVDGLQGTADKGGAAAIGSLLRQASQPVILTANEIYGDAGKKLSGIKTHCELVKFEKVSYLSIAKFLQKVCDSEGIDYDQKVLSELAKASNGDFRSALLDLQTVAEHSKKITLQDLKDLGFRERQQDVFKVLQKIFHARSIQECQNARFSADIDHEMLQRWIEENIPRHFSQADDRANAFNFLSKADLFNGRIMKRQHYGFLRYSTELATSGVALQREHHYPGFVSYKFPSMISTLGASKGLRQQKKAIAEKMRSKMHGSVKRIASEDLAFLEPVFKDEKKLVEWSALFDFDEANIAFLTGKKADSKLVKNLLKEAVELRKKTMIGKRKALQGFRDSEAQAGFSESQELPEPEKQRQTPDVSQTRLF